ncbi:DUF5702 domain-containing protein [Lachnospiraceae bacterium 29-84]
MRRKYNRIHPAQGGSITLFLALSMTLVLSFLFSLLEASRVQGLEGAAQRNAFLRMESAFGRYHVRLWEDYRMLFLDGAFGGERFDLALLEGIMVEEAEWEQKGADFLKVALKNMEITEYALATDKDGAAFRAQACKAIKEQLAAGAVHSLTDNLEKGQEIAEEKQGIEGKWDAAKQAVKDAQEDGEDTPEISPGMEEPKEEEAPGHRQDLPQNPMDAVDLLKRSAVLSAVVENPASISRKALSKKDPIEKRKKETGTMELQKQPALEKIWFLQYLERYFSCQSGAGEGGAKEHALDYELEYCIGGKGSDQENLEFVAKELLLLREAGNFATILQDGKKQALALEIAAAAVGFTGLPALVQAVKTGILLAWSYIESILDVRTLLAGGKAPLVKKVSEWKSDVSLGEKALKEKTDGKKEGNGLDYREYLMILLALVREDTLSCRAMDLVEQNIRLLGETQFRMDHQIVSIRGEATYAAEPLFLGFVTSKKRVDGSYHFVSGREICYY